jgi:hypothetical protein
MVISTDCTGTGSCKSNYHTITTMMLPQTWKGWPVIYNKLPAINGFKVCVTGNPFPIGALT